MMPDTGPDTHWIVLVCREGVEPYFELLSHEQLYHRRGVGVTYGPASLIHIYELEKTVRGYIDGGKAPEEVVTLLW